MIRFTAASVSQTGRATLGVRLMRLEDGAKVATLAKVEHEVDEDVSRETEDVVVQPKQVAENDEHATEDSDA